MNDELPPTEAYTPILMDFSRPETMGESLARICLSVLENQESWSGEACALHVLLARLSDRQDDLTLAMRGRTE